MNKKYISILALGLLPAIAAQAQVRMNDGISLSEIKKSSAFFDAGSTVEWNNSTNLGKGMIFPRVNLNTFTAFSYEGALVPSNYANKFDGFIVYNTNNGDKAGVGATEGTLTPGFWYYENKSATINGGTWRPFTPLVNNIYTNDGILQANRIVTQNANTLAFTGTATNAFSVDGTTFSVDAANNRVGIGTDSPLAMLDVRGKVRIADGSEGENKILTSAANGEASWKTISESGIASTNIYNANGSLTNNRTVTQAANTLAFTGTATNSFSVDGTTFSVDAANDRVGIGTTTPTEKLDVRGNAYVNEKVLVNGNTKDKYIMNVNVGEDQVAYGNMTEDRGIQFTTKSSSNGGFLSSITSGSSASSINNSDRYLKLNVRTNTGINDADFILRSYSDSDKRVGIGTNNPTAKLHVNGKARMTSITNGDQTITSNDLGIYNQTANNLRISQIAGQPLALYTDGSSGNGYSGSSATMVLKNSKVGIGTGDPLTMLDVRGKVRIADGSEGENKILTSAANGEASWKTLSEAGISADNIYNKNGSLTGNRTVTQAANTLAFTGTAVNAFSVDGSTFSVDAANNRVGIGFSDPATTLSVNGDQWLEKKLTIAGRNTNGNNTGDRYMLELRTGADQVGYGNISDDRGIAFHNDGKNPGFVASITAGVATMTNSSTDRFLAFKVRNNNHTDNTALMIRSHGSGARDFRVGIGTIDPTAILHVNGKARMTSITNGDQTITSNDFGIYNQTANNLRISQIAGQPLALYTDGSSSNGYSGSTATMVLKDSRVGIGTGAPTAKLHVKSPSNEDPLRLDGMRTGSGTIVVADEQGNLKLSSDRISVPFILPAVKGSDGAIWPYSQELGAGIYTENSSSTAVVNGATRSGYWKKIPGLERSVNILESKNTLTINVEGVTQYAGNLSDDGAVTYAIGVFLDGKLIGTRVHVINGAESKLEFQTWTVQTQASNLSVGAHKFEVFAIRRNSSSKSGGKIDDDLVIGGTARQSDNLNLFMARAIMSISGVYE